MFGKRLPNSVRKIFDTEHIGQFLRELVGHGLAFRHTHQCTSPVFRSRSFSPHIEYYVMWTNTEAKQVLVLTVQSNVVELESAVCA